MARKIPGKIYNKAGQSNKGSEAPIVFFGLIPNGTRDNHFLAFAVILFQFCIWEEKLRKKKPSFHTIENLYLDALCSLVHCNKKIREAAELLNIPFCRFAGVARGEMDLQSS